MGKLRHGKVRGMAEQLSKGPRKWMKEKNSSDSSELHPGVCREKDTGPKRSGLTRTAKCSVRRHHTLAGASSMEGGVIPGCTRDR